MTVLTTQLYLDESVNTEAFAASPYNEHTGRDTFNNGDNIYDASGLLATVKSGAATWASSTSASTPSQRCKIRRAGSSQGSHPPALVAQGIEQPPPKR